MSLIPYRAIHGMVECVDRHVQRLISQSLNSLLSRWRLITDRQIYIRSMATKVSVARWFQVAEAGILRIGDTSWQ